MSASYKPVQPLPDLLTQAEAEQTECPLARTFHERPHGRCFAGGCIFWRFKHPADGRFQSAVQREAVLMAEAASEKDDKARKPDSYMKQATSRVAAAPWRYIIPGPDDRGYCGAAGKPEVA